MSVEEYIEQIFTPVEGTIIDIETIGLVNHRFDNFDSRRFADVKPVIFGTLSLKKITIYYVKSKDDIHSLNQLIEEMLDVLDMPFYAFNSLFERGVFFNNIGRREEFKHELNTDIYEKKEDAKNELKTPNYDDPFNGSGRRCREEWEKGNWSDAIKHNRSCLLKERDIFLRRGSRKPDKLNYIPL